MARIPLPTLETMTPEQRRVYDAIVSGPRGVMVGPLCAAIHQPELADKWQQLGAQLRYGTSLPPRLSELAILVTARHWDSQFEWCAHDAPARAAGLAPEVMEAIRNDRRPSFKSADEEVIYDYVKEAATDSFRSAATYQRTLDRFGVVTIVELTALVGYYTMVAMTLNAHELPLPEGMPPPLPPRSGTIG